MKSIKIKKTAVLSNIIIVIAAITGLLLTLLYGNKPMSITEMFTYYTQDSNLLNMITSIFFLIIVFRANKKSDPSDMLFAESFRLIGVSCTFVTFFVVLIYLAPTYGPNGYQHMFFYGANFFYHLLCPLLSLVSFIFFEPAHLLPVRKIFIPLIPTFIYAVTAIILNCCSLLDGPYSFLKVYEQSIITSILWFIGIHAGQLFFTFLIFEIKERLNAKETGFISSL